MIPTFDLPTTEKYLRDLLLKGWGYAIKRTPLGDYNILVTFKQRSADRCISLEALYAARDADGLAFSVLKDMEEEIYRRIAGWKELKSL